MMYRNETLIEKIVHPWERTRFSHRRWIRQQIGALPRLAQESISHGSLQRNPRSSNPRLPFFPDDARCKSTERRLRLGSMTSCIRS